MKYLIIALAVILGNSLFGQQELYGKWRAPVKVLTLNTDNTFLYKKGNTLLIGVFDIEVMNSETVLRLQAEESTLTFTVDNISADRLDLYDKGKGRALRFSLIQKFESKNDEQSSIEVAKEDVSLSDPVEVEATQMPPAPIKDQFAKSKESPWMFMLLLNASQNSPTSNQLQDRMHEEQGLYISTSYRGHYSYGGGLYVGRKLFTGVHLGSGVSFSQYGYNKEVDISSVTAAEVVISGFQNTLYRMYAIEIPGWVEIQLPYQLGIRAEVVQMIPLKSTAGYVLDTDLAAQFGSSGESVVLSEQIDYDIPQEQVNSSLGYRIGVNYGLNQWLLVGLTYSRFPDFVNIDAKIGQSRLGLEMGVRF